MPKLVVPPPDPKEIIDSIGDGIVEILHTGSRLLERQGTLNKEIGDRLTAAEEDIKAGMPDRPEVLIGATREAVRSGVRLVTGTVDNTITTLSETGSRVGKHMLRTLERRGEQL